MKNIYERAQELGELKTWTASLEVANLVEILASEKELTVFAPTDQAFMKLERETVEDLLQDVSRLTQTLCYHIVEGKIETSNLPKRAILRTLFGDELILERMGDLRVNQALMLESDIVCRNGVIHTIDRVLVVDRPKRTGDLAARFLRSAAVL